MNIDSLILGAGLLGIGLVIFAESGLMVGFFLPGDSLIFTAGFLASQGYLNIYILCLVIFIAAVSGDSFGYAFGKKFGRKLFNKEDSLFFHKDHLIRAEMFYEKHGKKTIILARFVPFVRTFAPIAAGIAQMEYKTFITYNIVGGFLWSIGLSLTGFFLGRLIPNVDKYLLPIVFIIILFSVAGTAYEYLKEQENRESVKKFYREKIMKKKV